MSPLVFLPGASGSRNFWQALIAELNLTDHYHIVAYPGFDGVEAQPNIQNLDDLRHQISQNLPDQSILIAQSMGGVLAVGMALEQPERFSALVLMATSGGIDFQNFQCIDWRTDYAQHFPEAPDWFVRDQTQYQAEQLAKLSMPVLLLWGDQDPLSPVAVGQSLQRMLPHATLHVVTGGDHFFAAHSAEVIAPIIQHFFADLEQK